MGDRRDPQIGRGLIGGDEARDESGSRTIALDEVAFCRVDDRVPLPGLQQVQRGPHIKPAMGLPQP